MHTLNSISPETFIQNPYAYFAKARKINPVLKVNLFQTEGWLVTGYKEVEALLKDPRFISDGSKLIPPEQLNVFPENIQNAIKLKQKMMLFRDAPDHFRLRNLVNKAFTPRMIDKLNPTIHELVQHLIDGMKGKDQHEIITEFSYLLPIFVIAELLGVPKEDRGLFRKWSNAFVKFIDFNTTLSDIETVSSDILEASIYFKNLIAVKRNNPKDDLISNLLVGDNLGDKLDEKELIATCLLLLIAGHETTVNLITNGLYLLLKNPNQYELLRSNLSLISSTIEEVLRVESPVILTSRWAMDDFMFRDQQLNKADFMIVALGGANYDPEIFENPENFNIQRKNNKHLSFSTGPHFCLGAPLARLEAQIAIEKLIISLKNPELIEEPLRRGSIAFRGFESLKIKSEIK